MATVAVTAQATRLDDAQVVTQWGDIGTGPGGSIQGDWFYNDTSTYARKGATSEKGIFMSDNVTSDLTGTGTYEHVIIKYSTVTPGLLDSEATPGTRIYLGSNSTVGAGGSDNNIYYREGNDTWPLDKAWIVIAIDPTITAYRDTSEGTPDFSITDYFGFSTDQTGASKDLNLTMAAIDIGNGLTLTGGDGVDADGTWQDFADFDFGTATNRYGFVQSSEKPFFVTGKLIIGTATDTVFTDTGTVVVFNEALAAAGFNGLEVSCDTGNTYTEVNGTFIGNGDTTTTDTRPTLTFTGTGGSAVTSGCNYTNFSTLALVAANDWTDGTWVDSDQITMTGSPTVDGLNIINPTNDAAMVITGADDLDNFSNITFDGAGVGGTTADAAIEVNISAAGPHTIDLDKFIFQNRVGSSVDLYFVDQGADRTYTVNVLNSGTNATFTKARAGDTVTIVSAVDYDITNIQNLTEITVLDRDVSLHTITGTPADQNVGDAAANTKVGQSFQVTSAGNAERVRLRIKKVGSPTDELRMRLINGLPGTLGYMDFTATSASTVDWVEATKPINLESSSGDITGICRVYMDSGFAGGQRFFHTTAVQTNRTVSLSEAGTSIALAVYDSGATSTGFQVVHGLSDDTWYWIKWAYDHSAGAVDFYQSTDAAETDPTAISWTQMGVQQTGTARKVVNNDALMYVGTASDTANYMEGSIAYTGFWKDGTEATGVLVAEADWREAHFHGDYEDDGVGNFTWTMETESALPTFVEGPFADVPAISGEDLTTSYVEYDIDLDGKYALSTSTDYGVEIYRTGANDGSNYYVVEYSTASVDAGARYLYNTSWASQTGDLLLEVMEAASDNELHHVESVTTGTTTYTHDGTVRSIEVLAMSVVYKALVYLDDIGPTAKSQALSQTLDLVHSNP